MFKELRFNTLLKFYFGNVENFKQAAIKRAYRDLNRTLPLGYETQKQRDENRERTGNLLSDKLNHFLNFKFTEQIEFDNYHRAVCNEIALDWSKLKIGHIQKWVNMTLKYWLIIGNDRIKGIELNYMFFHIPIDSIILEKIFAQKNPKTPWSRIDNYDYYLAYQLLFRKKFPNEIPIIFETEIFNKSDIKASVHNII